MFMRVCVRVHYVCMYGVCKRVSVCVCIFVCVLEFVSVCVRFVCLYGGCVCVCGLYV